MLFFRPRTAILSIPDDRTLDLAIDNYQDDFICSLAMENAPKIGRII